jgi:hypothetical protein
MNNTIDIPDIINQIKIRFENSSLPQLLNFLEYFKNKWILVENTNVVDYIKTYSENFEIDYKSFEYDELYKNYKIQLYNVVYLEQKINEKLLLIESTNVNEVSEEIDESIKLKFNKIYESISYAQKILTMGHILTNSHSSRNIEINDNLGIYHFFEPDISQNSPYQNLLLFLLESIYISGYQRYQGNLYEKINYNGHFTHAWKEKISIKNFIYEKTQFCMDYRQWHNLTSNASNIKNSIDFLENCQDPRITDLIKNRHVFAFTNGIYICKEYDQENKSYIDHFYEYGCDDIKNIGMEVVAAKFFNCPFNNFDSTDDFYDIPTPHFQSILDYQEFPEDVCRWVYAFIGRLFYDLGDLDDWQVALFLEGVARSGKSTFTKIVKKFYEACDVGVLSNNIERKFGLSSLKDKLLFLAPEIKADLGLEQSEFQLLIEGGDMQLPVKYKDSQYIRWKTPGIFAGNEPPEYTDNSGSVSRRLLVLKFVKKVTNADPELDRKLEAEIPSLIKKSVSAYLGSINEYQGKDLWKCLPKYFRDTQADMAQSTNSLQHFICSGKVQIGDDLYCREKVFVQAFNEHCKESTMERHKFTMDYYLGVFGNYGIVIKKNCRMKYPNTPGARTYQGNFIFGLDLVNEIEESEEF